MEEIRNIEKYRWKLKFILGGNQYAYWIFTNRSNGAEDKHSIEEVINTLYYSISFGVFDVDNNILYYYEYER